MLVLSPSQAKNYFSKLHPHSQDDGCGCCHSSVSYRIDKNKILCISSGENRGFSYLSVDVIAKIKNRRKN